MLLSFVNKVTLGTECSAAFHDTETASVVAWGNVTCSHPPPEKPIIWKCARSLSRPRQNIGSSNRRARWRSHSPHTHADKDRAVGRWGVKWFCYHVVCEEYNFPSTLRVRCVRLMGCSGCVCVCRYSGEPAGSLVVAKQRTDFRSRPSKPKNCFIPIFSLLSEQAILWCPPSVMFVVL